MNTHPARGMRDFLPEDVRRRQYVIGVIADVYQRYGFEPLETPAVENIETLMGKYGEEGDRLIFRILKRGEEGKTGEADLALRYDLTVPLARVVAEYRAQLPKFFKRYQVQPVWRADRPQKGRFREFYQCDVDAIGSTSMVVEAELLARGGATCSTRLGLRELHAFGSITARLLTGDARRRRALPPSSTATRSSRSTSSTRLVATASPRSSRRAASPTAPTLLELLSTIAQPPTARRDPAGSIATCARDMSGHVDGHGGASAELDEIVRARRRDAAPAPRIRLDPSLARGLSYYTGSIFEIAVPDLAGSLGGGGRYDDLIGMFLGEQVPACGISLGLERILVVMGERNMFPRVADGDVRRRHGHHLECR